MILNPEELTELKTIQEYLDNSSLEIKQLGFDLYINNYKNKLKSYITRVRKINSEVMYRCDYKPKNATYSIIGSYLSTSIKDILNHL